MLGYLRECRDSFIRDFPRWADTTRLVVAIVLVGVGGGHLEDWFSEHHRLDLEIGLISAGGLGLLLLLTPRRWRLIATLLVTLAVMGVVNSFASANWTILPIIFVLVLFAYLIVNWRGLFRE